MMQSIETTINRRHLAICCIRGTCICIWLVFGVVPFVTWFLFWVTRSTTSWTHFFDANFIGSSLNAFFNDMDDYPAIAWILAAVAIWILQRRLARLIVPSFEHGCPQCGYSLKKLKSSKCPECGTPIPKDFMEKSTDEALPYK